MEQIESENVREMVTTALDLVRIVEKRALTTSLKVAEVFNKLHKNVLRDIANLEVPEQFSRLNFEPSTYKDERGKEQPMCRMTRDGFTLLAMGFTGPEAMQFKLKYIEAFNMMEEALRGGLGSAEPEEFRVWSRYVETYLVSHEEKLLWVNAKLDRLNENRGVTDSPINDFVDKTLLMTRDGLVLKESVWEAYVDFCQEAGIIPVSKTEFFRRLYDEHGFVRPVSRTINGKSYSCLKGLRFDMAWVVANRTRHEDLLITMRRDKGGERHEK